MTPETMTQLFLVAWIATAIVYDIWVFARWGPEPTITRTLQRWTNDFPVLLIALGGLLWHLFGKGK